MIPEVAAVVRAAKDLCSGGGWTPDDSARRVALEEAVDALLVRESRPAGSVTHEETDRTWGEVVAQDEILSAKTNRWYEVTNSALNETAGTIKINIKGSPKPIIRPIGDPVRVKRGELGDAADLMTLLWSGTHTLGQFRTDVTTGVGPMIQSHEETQELFSDEGE
jgi:hypothetical protein